MLFYPETYLDRTTEETLQDLRKAQRRSQAHLLTLIDHEIGREDSQPLNSCPNIFHLYLVVCLQWIALYPLDYAKAWFDLSTWTDLFVRCQIMQLRESALSAACDEGLGQTIFPNPSLPNPP